MWKDEESYRETLFLSARRERLREKVNKAIKRNQREFKFIVFGLRIEPLDDLENLK